MTNALAPALLLANVLATLFMFGAIWVVQLVIYPQFLLVGAVGFAEYHTSHTSRMGLTVALPMGIELATSAYLAFVSPASTMSYNTLLPPTALRSLYWMGFLLALATWGVTFFISIPLHNRLASGFDAAGLPRPH